MNNPDKNVKDAFEAMAEDIGMNAEQGKALESQYRDFTMANMPFVTVFVFQKDGQAKLGINSSVPDPEIIRDLLQEMLKQTDAAIAKNYIKKLKIHEPKK